MSDWKEVLQKVAPTVVALLGSPFAGVALEALGPALGLGESPKIDAVEKLVKTGTLTADNLIALRNAENSLSIKLEELGARREEFIYADAANARQRDIELARAGKSNVRADILAYGALLAFVLAGWALYTQTVPTTNRELVVYLLGALTVIVKDIYGFEFGSSKSSHDKTELMIMNKNIDSRQ